MSSQAKSSPADLTDLETLDETYNDADSLAQALNSALKDADEAIAKRRGDGEKKPSAAPAPAEEIEILEDSLDEAPGDGLAEVEDSQQAPASAPSAESASASQREAELYERLLRLAAEFENYKKRAVREREEFQRFALEKTILQLLPILDNFERALGTTDSTPAALLDGVRMILRQLKDTLGKLGLRGFDSLSKPFDPAKHQAVLLRERADVAPGLVVEEYQRGYFLHERLIRPAMVVVSQSPAPKAQAESEAPEAEAPEALEEKEPAPETQG